jgi:preprotein translocase subunit SecA
MRELERRVILSVLDRKWREHLYEMDYLQEGIGLRAVGQRDPLIEYQKEGYDLFIAMMDGIKEESVGFLFNVQVNVEEEQAAQEPAVSSGADDAHALFQAAEAEALPVTGGKAGGNGARGGQRCEGAGQARHRTAEGPRGAAAPPGNLQYSAPTVDGDTGSSSATGGHSGVVTRSGPSSAAAVGEGTRAGQASGSEPARNAECPCGSGKKYKRCHGDPRNRSN